MNGWQLGLKVARSVKADYGDISRLKPWEAEGISRATWYRRYDNESNEKISARAFAQLADVDHNTVVKYLRAWNKAAMEELVPHSSKLSPGQDVVLDDRHNQEKWISYLKKHDEVFGFCLDERHTPELWEYYYKGKKEPVVYFVGHKDYPELPVKIGKAQRVDDRVSNFQTGHYTELEVLLTIPGYSKEERELHKKYAEKHVRGEWYALTPEDLEEIRSSYGIRT